MKVVRLRPFSQFQAEVGDRRGSSGIEFIMTFRGKINARGYLPSEAQFCSCRRSYFCNVNFGCHYQEMVIFYIEVKFYFFDMNEEKKGAADELRQHETVCVG